MHSIKLEIEDSVFEKVIYFLKNLPKDEVKIIEEIKSQSQHNQNQTSETSVYSNHSANLIDEWKEPTEDEIWK